MLNYNRYWAEMYTFCDDEIPQNQIFDSVDSCGHETNTGKL